MNDMSDILDDIQSTGQLAGLSIAWYTPAAWERLAAMLEAQIEKTYREFVRDTETLVRTYAARGLRPQKAVIDVADVDEMVTWCHRQGYDIDVKGRAVYGVARSMGKLDAPVVDKTRSIQ
jgi:hypothetical protein